MIIIIWVCQEMMAWISMNWLALWVSSGRILASEVGQIIQQCDFCCILLNTTSATNSLCQFLVSTIRALRRTSGIFISANFLRHRHLPEDDGYRFDASG
jgi:hypothetical protein